MVVFVDLDHDAFNQHHLPQGPDALLHGYIRPEKPSFSKFMSSVTTDEHSSTDKLPHDSLSTTDIAHNTNQNAKTFSAALSCYPIVKELARSVDLNTLHALSRTCRQFHLNLIPYRQQLAKQTLRCENEYIETVSDMLNSGAAIPDSVKSVLRLLSQRPVDSGRITRGKVGKCARDMVAECRRCSKVVCRNCTIKPPTNTMLKNRIRRLCTTCRTVSISDHLISPSPHSREPDSSSPLDPSSFTAPAFLRTPCTCEDAVWLCHQCGHILRNNDTTYRRVWAWRTRYSTYLGGLGTGIGEGCQGVKCGRGEDCLAAQEIELEVVSEQDWADGLHNHGLQHGSSNTGNTLLSDRRDSPEEEEPGYFRQEIVGIGGRFKQKVKKRVMVGACVVEHEDERDNCRYLTREEEGKHRSWCGWCWRVIPAKND